MARNLSGLDGRSIMFWRGLIPTEAYIIKYMNDGSYLAIGKRDGMLYEFSQHTENEGKELMREVKTIKKTDLLRLDQLGIKRDDSITDIIKSDAAKTRLSTGDILDMIRDVLRLSSILLFIVAFVLHFCSLTVPMLFLMPSLLLAVSVFVGNPFYSNKDNAMRAALSEYEPTDVIDYSEFRARNRKRYDYDKEHSPAIPWMMIGAAVLVTVIIAVDMLTGRKYNLNRLISAGTAIGGVLIIAILVKCGVKVKGVKWALLALAANAARLLERNYEVRVFMKWVFVLAVIVFIYRNVVYFIICRKRKKQSVDAE